MSAAQALAQLAELIPERVRWVKDAEVWEIWADYGPWQGMTYTRHSIHPDEVVPPLTLAALSLTLEQECAARGWAWNIAHHPALPPFYFVGLHNGTHDGDFSASAPALALGRALAQAIAEGG